MAPLIDRTRKNEKAENYFQELSKRCEEILDLSNQVFDWVLEKKKHDDIDAPPILLFRQAIEVLDAITIQIRHQSIEPCKILLRAVFEIDLAIKYLLERDQIRRAKCYLFFHHTSQLKSLKRFDPTHPSGKEFLSELEEDKVVGNKFFQVDANFIKDLHKRIESYDHLLHNDDFKQVEDEFIRLKRGRGKFSWYSFFDGPTSIWGLARHFGMIAFYEILYRSWSTYAHGADPLTGNFGLDNDDNVSIIQLRYGGDAITVANFYCSFAFTLYRTMIKYFRPTKEKALLLKIGFLSQSLQRFLAQNPPREK